MKAWLPTALPTAILLLLAVPFHMYWWDYEIARRGVLACLVGGLCLAPRFFPRILPTRTWPFTLLFLWLLVRSFGVTNPGYAFENTGHMLALVMLMALGAQLPLSSVLVAAVPTGLVVAAIGIAQTIGWMDQPGSQPVSTLGNLNVASEVLAVCGASAALLCVLTDSFSRRCRWAALLTLFTCSAAVVLNTSMSGLLALPLGCLPCLASPGRLRVVASLVAGLVFGFLLLGEGEAPAPVDPQPPTTEILAEFPEPSTVAVRLGLWEGGARLVAQRPWVGYGSGQFQVEYPAVRPAEEIELSSRGRRSQHSPATAHNDYLQILVEGGPIALLLALLGAISVLRASTLRLAGPLVAFAFLAGVRAPLGNAPAAALVFLLAGALLGRADDRTESYPTRHPPLVRGSLLGCGIALLWVGVIQVGSQFAATDMIVRQSEPRALAASRDRALWFRPYDHRILPAKVSGSIRNNDLAQAREVADYLLEIAPHDVVAQLRNIELLRAEGNPDEALRAIIALRLQDPQNLSATLWGAELQLAKGAALSAAQLLYENNHPRMRAALAARLADFERVAQAGGDTASVAVLRREQEFLRVLDQLERNPSAQAAAILVSLFSDFEQEPRDPRAIILGAIHFHAKGDTGYVRNLLGGAQGHLLSPYAIVMGKALGRLREVDEWSQRLTELEQIR